jgi:hypothetical protein
MSHVVDHVLAGLPDCVMSEPPFFTRLNNADVFQETV